jgi:hypothetical protein
MAGPAEYEIAAPLLDAHSQLLSLETLVIFIVEIVVTGSVEIVVLPDALAPGPVMFNETGFVNCSVCACAISGVLRQPTAANARSAGRGVSVRNVFSELDLKSVHNDHTTGFPLKQAMALM